ncbi:aminotransferase class III-fold pyridoxal phosphate-dependent enzyme [Mesorhizobium sp. ANAO-SY3R2]|uniref:aminotransferase class III-fold pyridoxal phosphate-dependent enzyme n=1 Tax=Mesorhizobium sp. ANAO-SY3R2 TaxID=3166644 RepID=UPI003672C641
MPLTNSRDQSLRARAAEVIPGGMWGHMNARALGPAYPQFFERGEGARVWDVDRREYVDLMCSWGPNILGHRHAAVEEAAARQRLKGDALNGPGEVMVELAELMVATVAHAKWTMFQKNGTDATTACVTIARAGTGRRKVLVAKGSYHGAVPWCTPSLAGVTQEDRAHILHFDYNDVASLEAAVELAGSDLAAIIVTAFRHDIARDQEMPTLEFARRARELCTAADAALIIDDVRAGFRIDLAGSWEPLGVRPDLSAFSKSIANGYALAAVTGNDRFREAATKVYLTGSFWCGAVSMAAAVATIKVLRDTDALPRMIEMGERLRQGLQAAATRHGLSLRQTGPAQLPMVLFDGDPEFRLAGAFCAGALRAGAYFHPRHNMFLSAAHTKKDIDQALDAAEVGMAAAADIATSGKSVA